MDKVRPKKQLGQHFLNDENIARKIADTLSLQTTNNVLEIGPGTGVLTAHLIKNPINLTLIEIDGASVAYLKNRYPQLTPNIIHADFLSYPLEELFHENSFAIIGNFPYNISSQILFKTLALRGRVPELCGMFQREVAMRICEKAGSKTYGILSVLVQAFYEVAYLFTVPSHVFIPPPKVQSGVIHLTRKENYHLPCNEELFFKLVKTAFNQRRKTLRNSLKIYSLPSLLKEDSIFELRPEQLTATDFIELTRKIEPHVL